MGFEPTSPRQNGDATLWLRSLAGIHSRLRHDTQKKALPSEAILQSKRESNGVSQECRPHPLNLTPLQAKLRSAGFPGADRFRHLGDD